MSDPPPDNEPNRRSSAWLVLWFALMLLFLPPFIQFGPFAIVFPIPAGLAAAAMLGIRRTWATRWPWFVKTVVSVALPVLICGSSWLLMCAIFGGAQTFLNGPPTPLQ